MSSVVESSSRKRWEIVRLPLAMVMVGVLVALAAKVILVLPPPGILDNTEFLSAVLELANKGEREELTSLGLLASKMFPLLSEGEISQLSRPEKPLEPEPVRMASLPPAVEDPLKIQRVWLVGLSWLG